jgi:hypothetical protein
MSKSKEEKEEDRPLLNDWYAEQCRDNPATDKEAKSLGMKNAAELEAFRNKHWH